MMGRSVRDWKLGAWGACCACGGSAFLEGDWLTLALLLCASVALLWWAGEEVAA